MPKRYNIDDVPKIKDQKVFFDANVLIFLFWTTHDKRENDYSRLLGELNKNNVSFYTNTMVLSEFINVALREKYNLEKNENNGANYSFKKFRKSNIGIDLQKDVFSIVKSKILQLLTIDDKCFSNKDIENLLNIDNLDYNDKMIVSTCKEKKLILFTDDFDFSHSDIDILSCNNKFLKKQ